MFAVFKWKMANRWTVRGGVYDWTEYVYVTEVMLDLRRTVDYVRLVARRIVQSTEY